MDNGNRGVDGDTRDCLTVTGRSCNEVGRRRAFIGWLTYELRPMLEPWKPESALTRSSPFDSGRLPLTTSANCTICDAFPR